MRLAVFSVDHGEGMVAVNPMAAHIVVNSLSKCVILKTGGSFYDLDLSFEEACAEMNAALQGKQLDGRSPNLTEEVEELQQLS